MVVMTGSQSAAMIDMADGTAKKTAAEAVGEMVNGVAEGMIGGKVDMVERMIEKMADGIVEGMTDVYRGEMTVATAERILLQIGLLVKRHARYFSSL